MQGVDIPLVSTSMDIFQRLAAIQAVSNHVMPPGPPSASPTPASSQASQPSTQQDYVDLTVSDDEGYPSASRPKAATNSDDDVQLVGQIKREPEVQLVEAPLLLGQIECKLLMMHKLDEIRQDPNKSPMPLLLCLRRTAPNPKDPNSKETVWVSSCESGETFGTLCQMATPVLGPVMAGKPFAQRAVRFVPFIDRIRPEDPDPFLVPLHVLVITTPLFVQPMSDHLFKQATYLHQPTIVWTGPERYSNPHAAFLASQEFQARRQAIADGAAPINHLQAQQNAWRTAQRNPAQAEEAKREQVEAVFAQMNSGMDLETVEPDELVTTTLYTHQKQALAFLLDRERLLDLPPKGAREDQSYVGLWKLHRTDPACWLNVVTGIQVPFSATRPQLPPQCRGAILADDMGLGKTIVIISLISNSLREGRQWATVQDGLGHQPPSFDAIKHHPVSTRNIPTTSSFSTTMPYGTPSERPPAKKKKGPGKKELKREEAEARRLQRLSHRSGATLIICPLSTVQNWESQIKEHTAPGTLRVHIYHGPSRCQNRDNLASYDVVITTFSTLGAEYSKQARAEDSSESEDNSEIEEVDANGMSKAPQPLKKKRKRAKPAPGTNCMSPLQQIEWFRVVLDEAHMIKEHSTIQSRAACELSAQRRICLSGTPLQNSLNDLYSLVKFLQLEPFTDRAVWTHFIGGPAKSGDPLAVSRLQLLVRHIALRRNKDTKNTEGKPILSLPPKKDQIVYLDLDEQERAFYASHHRRYKSQFLALEQNDTLLQNYASILQELLRLRQICVHYALVRDSEDAKYQGQGGEDDPVELISKHGVSKPRAMAFYCFLRDSGSAQCAECGYELVVGEGTETPPEGAPAKKKTGKGKADASGDKACVCVITKCTHIYCIGCFKCVSPLFPKDSTAEERVACTICKTDITPILDAVALTKGDFYATTSSDGFCLADNTDAKRKVRTVEHSTKIRELMADLMPFSKANPASKNYIEDFGEDMALYDQWAPEQTIDVPWRGQAIKSVVFSQWTKLLDRVGDALQESQIKYNRLDGSMKREDRSKAMDDFREDPSCEVLLVSLRAGGVGLNLTMASRVYLMEPFWNPAVENQATDRIHRLGATKPVKITRYIAKRTIEENMLEIQKRKMELANMGVGQTLSKAQLAERRIQDLKILFKD